jgi:CubicO group peptidase (beta-lactamase class C family)
MKVVLFFILIIDVSYASCFNTDSNQVNAAFPLKSEIESLIAATSIEKASLYVGNSQGVLFKSNYGHNVTDLKYDIASLTKLFTATTLMKVLDESGHSIEDKFVSFFPNVNTTTTKDKVTLENLLRHNSGYKSGVMLSEMSPQTDESWEKIRNLLPSRKYGKFLYSDINYLQLGEVIKRLSTENIDKAFRQNLLSPLGLLNTSFYGDGCRGSCAETSTGTNVVVHDPTSQHLDGIAGNAGLFSTIDDMGRFAALFLNKGMNCNRQIVSQKIIRDMTTKKSDSSRGLGFDFTSPYSVKPRGDYFSFGKSFGHTGYTGTSLWIDPEVDVFVVFLTNAVKSKAAKKDFLRINKKLSSLIGKYFYSLKE